jgi:hypothetical protein
MFSCLGGLAGCPYEYCFLDLRRGNHFKDDEPSTLMVLFGSVYVPHRAVRSIVFVGNLEFAFCRMKFVEAFGSYEEYAKRVFICKWLAGYSRAF